MKPTLHISVLVSLLVAITGCATQGKPPPAITLDEPVAAQVLPELPKPIEVVAVPEPLPLPAQMKPLPMQAGRCAVPGLCQSGTCDRRVAAAR